MYPPASCSPKIAAACSYDAWSPSLQAASSVFPTGPVVRSRAILASSRSRRTAVTASLRPAKLFACRETARSPPSEYLYARRWRIWGVVMIGLFMALIDVTIVNISIPQLQRDLDAPGEHGLVGAERLQHRVRGAARLDGPAGGPVRPPAVLPDRDDDLHGRLAALRALLVDRGADRVPHGAGGRRRASSRRSRSRPRRSSSRPPSAGSGWR